MKPIKPYTIRHVRLDNLQQDDNIFPEPNESYYLVLWYHSIALGHLYLEAGQQYKDWREKVWNAVSPAIYFYNNKKVNEEVLKESFINNNDLLSELLKQVLDSELSQNIPATVPVSLIICTANRNKDLEVCLHSLSQQTCMPEEIIIVDNSPDVGNTKSIAEKWNAIYCLEQQKGLSYARNTGIKKATKPVIAWVDDDVTLHPLWCYHIWKAFMDSDADVVLGLVLAAELETESQQVFEKHWTFNRGYIPKTYDLDWFNNKLAYGPPVWELGAGANMAFKKEVFDKVGLFDVRLGAGTSGCSEDSEIWFRILKQKGTIYYEPKCIVYHTHRKGMEVLKKQLKNYMRGFVVAALLQQRQHPSANYKKQLFQAMPKYYINLFRAGFPGFNFRYTTLKSEMIGIAEGFVYYFKHKDSPSHINSNHNE